MIKQKLFLKRQELGYSQEYLAEGLGLSQSQYSRREKGVKKISDEEWEKLAELLKVPVEEIKELDKDKNIVVNNDNQSGNFSNYGGNNNTFHTTDKETIAFLLEHIKKLEKEIEELRGGGIRM